ncbi:conserved protein of unknown function [Rhodovastum atsumiense]|uniref:EAL domain-containing protein n=1 Tax=Rhodovastum atsumiense TaxID=504468 RepID=A0A5M6IT75_9PROT|nr:hypothetical protein [Rhodovastum atsumiense]KAA5611520.1 hypothetical protein F1189_14435 [Rhodovastum atsumiense]CAH2601220.1 conserved protein of unknown function [Rhodovastum atsumiense]
MSPWPRRPTPAQDVTDIIAADTARLGQLARDCAGSDIGREVLLLRLSGLPEVLARPHHLRLAQAAIDPLVDADRAERFALPNGDVAIVWRGDASAALQTSMETVLHLFADEGDVLPDPDTLTLTLHLPQDAGTLLRIIEDASRPPDAQPSDPEAQLDPLDPQALAGIERDLASADVARFVRRRQICEATEEGLLPCWETRHLSITEIAAQLCPDRSVRADPWLFRRLTRTLDRRMLALLAAPQELREAGPFSLNLNVASVLSPEFLRFDAVLPGVLRGQVVIDLALPDLMADPAAFLFARDFAHTRGYRLGLRDVTPELLEVFPLHQMELDLLQLRWSAALADGDGARLPEPGQVVLCHVDTPAALAWGLARGITLYQGRAVHPLARA